MSLQQPGGGVGQRGGLYDLSKLLKQPRDLPSGLAPCRHEFEGVWPDANGGSVIRGWGVLEEGPWTTADLYLNGERVAGTEPIEREDLKRDWAHIPYSSSAGFFFHVPTPNLGVDETARADVVLFRNGKPEAWMWAPLRMDIERVVPAPPAHLMKRVIGTDRPNYFFRFALTCFGHYMAAASKYKDLTSVKRMLDWGCGCGRVTAHYLRIIDGPEVTGCDIDREDIAWCQENLTGGKFVQTSPYVPLPFETGEFDLVVSLSVMTHLTRDQQNLWLKEIDRILAPGGLFVCSVHGKHAALAQPQRFVIERLLKEGFFDDLPDQALDGIAPEGYYRNTYQNVAYTKKSFGKVFDVLEVIEPGVGIQDLVIARKSEKPRGFLGRLRI